MKKVLIGSVVLVAIWANAKNVYAAPEWQRIRDRDMLLAASGRDNNWKADFLGWAEKARERSELDSRTDEKKQQIRLQFAEWLRKNPPKMGARNPRIKIKELCGFEFGDECPVTAGNDLEYHAVNTGTTVPFPPFTTVAFQYSKTEGHPLESVILGYAREGCGVDPSRLTRPGDYEHEAVLIKDRVEKILGVKLSADVSNSREGVAYEYRDDYYIIVISACNDSSKWNKYRGVHPLQLTMKDRELFRQSMYINGIFYTGGHWLYFYSEDKVLKY